MQKFTLTPELAAILGEALKAKVKKLIKLSETNAGENLAAAAKSAKQKALDLSATMSALYTEFDIEVPSDEGDEK